MIHPAPPARSTAIAGAGWILGLALLLGLAPAMGQTSPAGWKCSLGAGVLVSPDYPGAKRLSVFPFPDFEATYNDWFFVSPIDGIGAGFQPAAGLTLSVALGVDFEERRARDDPRLAGLTDIRFTPDVRFNARYEAQGFFLDGTLHTRLGAAAGRGTLLDVDAGGSLWKQGTHYVSTGVTCSLMDATYARNFFGINATQSAATGLPVYHAERGLKDAGLFVECQCALSPQWDFFARLQISRLVPPAANSPIVLTALQPSLLVTIARQF